MKIYVAGPMRGIPWFNFPAFDEATKFLRAAGHEVCNPAERDRKEHGDKVNASPTGDLADLDPALKFNLRETLAWDLAWIAAEADAIAVLPGWENSKGAKAETALAHALGLEVKPWEDFLPLGLGNVFKLRLSEDVIEPDGWHLEDDNVPRLPDDFRPNPLPKWMITGLQPDERIVPLVPGEEVRMTSETGGQKGVKVQRYDLIPSDGLRELATLYGRGAEKYDERNWERGYPVSQSFGAMMRHAWAWWDGEDIDPEMQVSHMACVAWHAMVMMRHQFQPETYGQFDNRPKPPSS